MNRGAVRCIKLKIVSSEVGEAEYERFLDTLSAVSGPALAYHYPFYMRFLTQIAYPGSASRLVAARDAAGTLAGVMPALRVKTADLHAWLSLAYFGPNGGALVPDAGSEAGAGIIASLVAQAVADACEGGCESMTVYTPLGASPAPYRDGLGGADFEIERVAQVLALPPLPDGPAASPWPRKVRYDIRRAASLGVVARNVTDEAELDRVWDIYQANCQDAGTPVKPRGHIRQLFRTAGPHGIFLAAEHAGEIVAGLICLMGGGVLSYYLPCTRAESRSLQPGLLLLDRAVAIAREAGCRRLNFEASPGVGDSVYQFKARSGGQPVPYRVLVKLLARGVLEKYRALGASAIAAQIPHAFIVPFEALT